MDKMNILAFDTSQDNLKIGLLSGGKTAYCDMDMGLKHIENLLPEIDRLYKSIGEDKSATNYIGVCCGPGSFTGIRIGIAAALGFSFGRMTACFGFSVFDVYKYLSGECSSDVVVPVIDAKKERFYCAFIEENGSYEMLDITPGELITKAAGFKDKKIIFTGRDFKLLKEKASIDFDYSYQFENGFGAKELVDYSKSLIESAAALEPPKPIYLRKSEAEIELLKSKGKI